jgi:uncharacterized Fe-S radical SAM superfamily protein PflX
MRRIRIAWITISEPSFRVTGRHQGPIYGMDDVIVRHLVLPG